MINTGNIGGNPIGVRTVALDSGGHVVLWPSSFGGSINGSFQRFDAFGVQVGAASQIARPSQPPMFQQNVAVACDGTCTIMTQDSSEDGLGQWTLDGNGAGAPLLIATLTPITGACVAFTGAELAII